MITVWGRENSTNVKKVLWCLEELNLPYRSIPAGGKFGLTHDPDYLAMNPNGLVPCLYDDAHGLTLWESNTIVRYLAAEYGAGSLWLNSPAARARGEKWMDWVATSLAVPHAGVFISLVRHAPDQQDPELIARSMTQCNKLFAIVNAELAKNHWLGGETFGPGDIALGPIIYNLFNLDIKWDAVPHLQRWYQQLTERPAFQKRVSIGIS